MIAVLPDLCISATLAGSSPGDPRSIAEYKFGAHRVGDARHCAVVSDRTSDFRRTTLDCRSLPWYIYTMTTPPEHPIVVERVQTGVRMEKRLLKVLKGLAELKDMTLGDLLEGIVLHAFEGKAPFSDPTIKEIEKLRGIYGLTLRASDSHQLKEKRK